MVETFRLGPDRGGARCVRIGSVDALPAALQAMELSVPWPVMVLVGGAGGLAPEQSEALAPVFVAGLVPAIRSTEAVVIDGGTDAGIMRLLGEARAAQHDEFRLVGVVAEGTVRVPGGGPVRSDAADLEPHHTDFLLVPGDAWGDESIWISRAASYLGGSAPSVTVLVNGGDIAYRDVAFSVAAGRPVLVIAGSGRVADEITGALRGERADPRAAELAASGLVSWVDAEDPPRVFQATAEALASSAP